MRNVEVLLQVIGSNHARTTILITWPASISALGAHMIQTHQPSNSMFTTSFTPIAQVMGHLAVAIDLPTTVPATLDKLNDASILRSEEHTSELQSRFDLVCRLLLEKKNIIYI